MSMKQICINVAQREEGFRLVMTTIEVMTSAITHELVSREMIEEKIEDWAQFPDAFATREEAFQTAKNAVRSLREEEFELSLSDNQLRKAPTVWVLGSGMAA